MKDVLFSELGRGARSPKGGNGMAAGNFNDVQDLLPNGSVNTKGPLDDDADVLELCVWVVQRTGKDESGADDANDAAATEMTDEVDVLPGPPREWELLAEPIPGSKPLTEGPAVGMAIAMLKVTDTNGVTNGVQLWSQSIVLKRVPASAA